MSEDVSEAPLVLFADDDPDVLTLMGLYAEKRGWKYETAARAREIIRKVNERCEKGLHCYDAIVTDVNFMDKKQTGELIEPSVPRISGTHVVKMIREKYPNVPVIFYTGFDTMMVRKQAQEAGGEASDFVVKSSPAMNERHKNEYDRVLDRVQYLIEWMRKRKLWQGQERRAAAAAGVPQGRRENDDPKDHTVHVSPVIERLLGNATRLLRGDMKTG